MKTDNNAYLFKIFFSKQHYSTQPVIILLSFITTFLTFFFNLILILSMCIYDPYQQQIYQTCSCAQKNVQAQINHIYREFTGSTRGFPFNFSK